MYCQFLFNHKHQTSFMLHYSSFQFSHLPQMYISQKQQLLLYYRLLSSASNKPGKTNSSYYFCYTIPRFNLLICLKYKSLKNSSYYYIIVYYYRPQINLAKTAVTIIHAFTIIVYYYRPQINLAKIAVTITESSS